MLIAARVAPLTRHIGLVPTAVVTHTEPFHLSKAIATLDYVSPGRAGVRVQVSAPAARGRATSAAARCRCPTPARRPGVARLLADLFDEAADYVEVLRRLWDSWEDDAEIRDVATGRFIDRDKLHYIDFEGAQFSRQGARRSPRGRRRASRSSPRWPTATVAVPARRRRPPTSGSSPRTTRRDAAAIVARSAPSRTPPGAAGETVHVFGDLVVFLDDDRRRGRGPQGSGSTSWPAREYVSDAQIFAGTPAQLADLLQEWQAAGLTGSGCGPASLPDDLAAITARPGARAAAARRVPRPPTRPARCAGCSACPGPPTATPPSDRQEASA